VWTKCTSVASLIAAAILTIFVAQFAGAQSRYRFLAAAGPSVSTHAPHASLGVERLISDRWLAVRGEATLVGWTGRTAPVAASVNAVVPILDRQLRPYLIGGIGVYGVGGVRREAAVNGGAGLEYQKSRVSYYAEVRKHVATRSMASFGVLVQW
jgi:hypothetical protein